MANAARNKSVESQILTLVSKYQIMGNTGISWPEFIISRLKLYSRDYIPAIAAGTGLSPKTIAYAMDSGDRYDPKSSTIHRLGIYFGLGAIISSVRINKNHQNVPKDERLF